MRSLRYFFLLITAGLIVYAIDTTQAQGDSPPAPDNGYCLVCHSQPDRSQMLADGSLLNLSVPADSLIHGQHANVVGCVNCHGPMAFPHLNPAPASRAEFSAQFDQACTDCHADSVQQVAEGNHAEAILAGADVSGVSCVTCHGAHQVHPVADMSCNACHGTEIALAGGASVLDVSLDTCVDCHAGTIAEWQRSGHGQQQLACSTCHFPHENRLRFETTEALCLNCHNQARDDFTHVTHLAQSCADCHIYRNQDIVQHVSNPTSGQSTGHDNLVTVNACLDCHSRGVEVAQAQFAHPLIEAEQRVSALEAEIESARQQGANLAAVRLAQSAVIGLALGMAGLFLFGRFLSYRRANHR